MKKNLLLFILLSVVGVVSSFAEEWTDSNGVTWTYSVMTYNDVTGAAIRAAVNCPAEVVVPAAVGTADAQKSVKWIGHPEIYSDNWEPFRYNTTVTRVTIPDGVQIGNYAFIGCSNLEEIDLSACTSIGYGAFRDCQSLTSIGDLSSCTYIGNEAFYRCPIARFSLGANVRLERSNAVPECSTFLVPAEDLSTYKTAEVWSSMATRIIPNDVVTQFEITISETPSSGSAVQNEIEKLGGDLANVMSLRVTGNINSYDIFIMRNQMPNLHILDLTDARIVESDKTYYNTYKTENDVIGPYAFVDQLKLTDVKLPSSIKEIKQNAFQNCKYITNIKIYEGVEYIKNYAFQNLWSLKSITIPEGVKELGENSLTANLIPSPSMLQDISLPSTLEKIGRHALGLHTRMKSINIPSNVNEIGDFALSGCESLEEVVLPTSLRSIGSNAFEGCNSLRTIKATAIDPNSVTMKDNSFDNNTYATAMLYVPYDEKTGWKATRDAYYWHTQWGQFVSKGTWEPKYNKVFTNSDYEQLEGTIPFEKGPDCIYFEIGNRGGYLLGKDAKQDVDKLKIKHNGKDGASIIDENSKLTANELTCDIDVVANKWYFFCFPFNVDLNAVTAPGESVWRKYNAAVRASQGNGGWQKLGNEEKTLKAGQGYIFQCNTAGTLVITVDNPDFSDDNKSAQLEENVAANAQDASWNFVGNPFLSYYELEDLGHNAPITYWDGSKYVAVRSGDDDYALQPFQAFFVQKTADSDEVTVDKDKRETKQQSEKKKEKNKARRAKQLVNPDRLLVNLEITDGQTTDKTRVVFNDRQQMGYEPECDAAKFMSTEQVPQLYTYYNKVNYAINERPNIDTEVNLAFTAPKAGEYTISATRMDTPMLLRDTELGITFDFQTGGYTFECKAGTDNKRFVLVKNNTETAIQPVTVGDAESAAFFNLAGQKTSANAKGIVISNGKKVLNK